MEVTDAQPKKILYVITKANWGGAQRYVYDLAVASFAAGYEVTVACGFEGELTERLFAAHIPTLLVPGLGRDVDPSHDLEALGALLKLMRALRPDVVHANSSKAGLLATIAARIEGVPHILFTAHGWAFNESRPEWQKIIFAFFHTITIWLSDTVICVSEAVKRDALQLPFAEKKLVVIHNGIAPVALRPAQEARERLAVDVSAYTWIGSIAELHRTKGLDVLVDAFVSIAERFPTTALVLIGAGKERAQLESLVPASIRARVQFCGHVSEAATYLRAFSIFVLPSRSEALGYVLLEAGQARLPVIATNVGGIPEIIEHEKTGLLIEPNDVPALARDLARLLDDENLRLRLGTALHEQVKTAFNEEAMIAKTLALYTD